VEDDDYGSWFLWVVVFGDSKDVLAIGLGYRQRF
jgi:hypothetical protein